jgi:DNA recombination protein RmuC
MDVTSLSIGIGIGALLAALIVYLALSSKSKGLQLQLDAKRDLEQKQIEIDRETNAKLERLQGDIVKLSSDCARFEAEAQASEKAFTEARNKLGETFNALSADALRKNNAQFLELAQEAMKQFSAQSKGDLEKRQQAIESLVKPINDQLGKVELHITEMEKGRASAYSGLTEQVKSLVDTQIRLDSQAKNLVQALRSTNTRGRWGEIQLQNLVEMAGMMQYCDFEVQASVDTEDGKLRPDLIVRMPNQHQIIVDSKAPITSYLEGHEEEDDALRAIHFQKFSASVRDHVKALGAKSYWSQFQSAEFVVMFLPGEPFLGTAMRHDPEIFEFAFKQNVILATPTTLLALLKAVAYGWRQEQLGREAQKIAEEGKNLHEKIVEFMTHFVTVGAALDKAKGAYEAAEKKIGGPMKNSAVRLEKLGAKGKKALPKGAQDLDDEEIGTLALVDAFDNNSLEEPVDESGLFVDEEPVS